MSSCTADHCDPSLGTGASAMLEPGEFTTPWMLAGELEPRLELADLVEFRRVAGRVKRRVYTHWAVFIERFEGKAYVAHVATDDSDFGVDVPESIGPCDSFGGLSTKLTNGGRAQVRRDLLEKVARGDYCRINNSLDRSREPFPPVIVVDRALLMLGTGNYNLLFNNCEHFVKHCRYGSKESEQATVAKSVIVGSAALLISGSMPVAIAAGCVGYTLSKLGRGLKRVIPIYPDALL